MGATNKNTSSGLVEALAQQHIDEIGPSAVAPQASLVEGQAEAQRGRSLPELAQNTEDSLHRIGRGEGRLLIVQAGRDLLVANDGAPFTPEDMRAIVAPGLSNKAIEDKSVCPHCGVPKQTLIGHKGIGFTATRELSRRVGISSVGKNTPVLAFRLDPKAVWPRYVRRWEAEIQRELGKPQGLWREANLSSCPDWFPALAPLPWDDVPTNVQDLHRRGFTVVFRFEGAARRGSPAAVLLDPLRRQLGPALLFLHHLRSVRVELASGSDEIVVRESDGWAPRNWRSVELTYGGGRSDQWYVREDLQGIAVPDSLRRSAGPGRELTKFRRAVAAPRVPDGEGQTCVHYPTDQPSGSALHLHADFRTDPSRRVIHTDHPFNVWATRKLAEFLVTSVTPGLRDIASRETDGSWLLQVLAHKKRPGHAAGDVWAHAMGETDDPPSRTLHNTNVVPVRRARGEDFVKPDSAVRLEARAPTVPGGVFPVGIPGLNLVPPTVQEKLPQRSLLKSLGVRTLGLGDLKAVARAFQNKPLTRVAHARRVVELIHRIAEKSGLGAGELDDIRALPIFPIRGANKRLEFVTSGREGGRTRRRVGRRTRPWLHSDRFPPPPHLPGVRETTVARHFQFERDDRTERAYVHWLDRHRLVRKQVGRRLVLDVGRDLLRARNNTKREEWLDHWAAYLCWAVSVFFERVATEPEKEHREDLSKFPLPALRGGRPAGLVEAGELLLPRADDDGTLADLELLGASGPPLPDIERIEGWLGDLSALEGLDDDFGRRGEPVLWNLLRILFCIPPAVPFPHPQPNARSRPSTQFESARRASTSTGRALQDSCHGAYREYLEDLDVDRPHTKVGRQTLLPAWAYDVLAAGKADAGRALYRLLDRAWGEADDPSRFLYLRSKWLHVHSYSAFTLRSQDWIPCTDGRRHRPGHAVHRADHGGGLEERLLPFVPSDEFGPFERDLGVGSLAGVETLARTAGRLVDAPPKATGDPRGATVRSAWTRTLHGLYNRLDDAIGREIHKGKVEVELRRILVEEMPRVLAWNAAGGGSIADWSRGLVLGVPRELLAAVCEERPAFYFRMPAEAPLMRLLGARPYAEQVQVELSPPWGRCRRVRGTLVPEHVRPLLAVALRLLGDHGAPLTAAWALDLRSSPNLALQVGGTCTAVRCHAERGRANVAVVMDANGSVDPADVAEGLDRAFPGRSLRQILGIPLVMLQLGREERAWDELADRLEQDRGVLRALREDPLGGLPGEAKENAAVESGESWFKGWRSFVPAGEVAEENDAEDGPSATPRIPADEELDEDLDDLKDLGVLAGANPDAPDDRSSAAGGRGGALQPRRPNAALGRAAEHACHRRLRNDHPGETVHDVHRTPYFGADFVVSSAEASDPPTRGSAVEIEAWLETHAVRLVECKGASGGIPASLLFADGEYRRAGWAADHSVPYEVQVWVMESVAGRWCARGMGRAPAPGPASLARVHRRTWLLALDATT
jgi:hypothetical protein